jgi:soluble lytic murein transglycosylase-like protein
VPAAHLPTPPPSAFERPAPRAAQQAVKLPAASRWALPPLIRVRPGTHGTAAGAKRALKNPALALAPAVAKALRRGDGAAAIAPLANLAPSDAGPLLVLRLDRGAAVTQAASIERTREVVAALGDLPLGERPRVLLEPAPGDLADASGPPPPRAGELRSLKPVYLQAGMRHGIAWQVLAAINTVETGLGTNVNVSSAGAVGWMQFMPGTWRMYGVDASGDGIADPNDPYDAIESAAIYLEAAGGRRDIRRAVFAYNHAWWYVDRVLRIAARMR